MSNQITLTALQDLPLVKYGDDLCSQITDSLARESLALRDGDIIVVAQKIISKAEGRTVDLNTVIPGKRALELAKETQKDARVVELILGESKSIVRKKIGVMIVEHNRGWIMANAGIDASNVGSKGTEENVLLLPAQPRRKCNKSAQCDDTAARLRCRCGDFGQFRAALAVGHHGCCHWSSRFAKPLGQTRRG